MGWIKATRIMQQMSNQLIKKTTKFLKQFEINFEYCKLVQSKDVEKEIFKL